MECTSQRERQPLSSSAVTTSTLECSASKCSLSANSPPGEDTTAGTGTPGGRDRNEGVSETVRGRGVE